MSQSPDGPADRESLERCAMQAQLRGDPMLGTAFPAGRIFLVEQPGPWGRGGLSESQFDPAVARQLEAGLGRRGVRMLAIRSPGRQVPGHLRRWGFADCRPGREQLTWGRFDADTELLTLDIDAPVPSTDNGSSRKRSSAAGPGRVADAPSYLVCAHSKHDPCCAVRGRPVAAALHAARPGQTWECSHVGGERFAANVLVLPYGLLYGRILAFSAADLADVTDRGEVVAPLLRGRVGLAPAAQAALVFAHSLTESARIGDIRVLGVQDADRHQILVRLDTPSGPMSVTVAVERSESARLTCAATDASRFWIYRPTAQTTPAANLEVAPRSPEYDT